MISLSEKIRILIKRKGLQMQDVAAALNMSRQNFSNKIKRGTFYPEELQALASVLGCSVDIIFKDNITGDEL